MQIVRIILISALLMGLSACGGAPPPIPYFFFPHDKIEYVFWEEVEKDYETLFTVPNEEHNRLAAEAQRSLISMYLSGCSEPVCFNLNRDDIKGFIFESDVDRDLLCGKSNCESDRVVIIKHSNSDSYPHKWLPVSFSMFALDNNAILLRVSSYGSHKFLIVSRNSDAKIVFGVSQ